MKKFSLCALALLCLLSFSFSAMAAGVDFVSSISNKGAPEIENVGNLVDGEGNTLSEHGQDCVIVTPIGDAETSDNIPEASKKDLLGAYKELSNPDTKLSELVPDLNKIVEDALGDGKNADNLVVKDLFDVSTLCDELGIDLPKDGTSIDLTFDASVGEDDFIVAMVYVLGAWRPLNTVNNNDGTVTVTFDSFGPTAFMVPVSASAGNVPQTGNDDLAGTVLLWGGIMAVALIAIVVLVVLRRKNAAK